MKNLKLTAFLLLFVAFMACRKDRVVPQTSEEPFNIEQNVLVTKKTDSRGWVTDIQLTTFEGQGRSKIFTELGAIADNGFKYNYEKGILKLFYNSSVNSELKIENNTIKSATMSEAGKSYKLIKIPAQNPLNGNTYSGGWGSEGSLLMIIANLKFSDTHFSEASINLPLPNKTYELLKNIAAYKEDEAKSTYTLWILSDGKLEGYRNIYNGNTRNRTTGIFTKQ